MPGRSYTAGNQYRYGFNGKENDNEVKGEGNQQNYGMRIYDPRIGKFLSVDPLTKDYPWYTPYQFAGNKPIWAIDLDGLEEWTTNTGNTVSGPFSKEYALKEGLMPKGKPFTLIEKSYLPPIIDGSVKVHEPWEGKVDMSSIIGTTWSENINGKNYSVSITKSFSNEPNKGIGEASGATSLIPIYGSGRNAINDFQNGRYIGGTVNGILAVSDLFLAKSLFEGVTKGGFKAMSFGNKPWRSYRKHYLETGFTEPGQPLHHWLIHQNSSIGKHVPDAIKNQMFNLKSFSSHADHMIYGHGHNYLGQRGASAFGQLWHGTPTWPKLFTLSYGGRGVQFILNNSLSNSNNDQ